MACVWVWDQGDGAACAPKSERIFCLVSFWCAGSAVVGVAITGGAWKSREKRSFSDEGIDTGTGMEFEVT